MQRKLIAGIGLALGLATSPALAATFAQVDENADENGHGEDGEWDDAGESGVFDL